jgi:mono/diheme cytochrome c family protein
MRKPWYSFLYVRSPITKILYGILSVIISIAALGAQQYMEEPRMAAQTGNWEGRSIEKGAEIFANNCANCHGLDGKGLSGVAPALNSKYFFTQRLSDLAYTGSMHDYVELTVAAGRPSRADRQWAQMMPTWGVRYGGPLRDDQVMHVTNFVLNWREESLTQSWDPTSENLDPWQPFQDGPSRATTGSITYTVGMQGALAVLPEQVAGAIVTPTETTEVTGPRTGRTLFVSLGCGGCHLLGDIGVGVTGPDMNQLHEVAATRVPGEDAVTYVRNSIVDPNAYIVENYSAGLMPADLATKMSEDELNTLVEWLLDPNRTYE